MTKPIVSGYKSLDFNYSYNSTHYVFLFFYRPLPDSINIWKGVLSSGKTGLFNPAHTVAYFANFPTTRPSFSRADSKCGIYASKRR